MNLNFRAGRVIHPSEPMHTVTKIEWKWGALAALAITVLGLYPQLNLWIGRGREWQGSYVRVQGDEDAYSAYINALIDGRPRRNDPHTGRDHAPDTPQPESLFSVQFVPAYALAIPARALGMSASTVFILLTLFAAIASSLAIFWLITCLTGDARLAMVGVMCVLCLGTLVATQGEARAFLGSAPTYSFFLFLRRYQPAAPFPLFFVLCVFVWRALKSEARGTAIAWATAAGALIALLIFSYFYLWTAAAAWLACLASSWLIWRPAERTRTLIVFGLIGTFMLAALAPYAVLLSRRPNDMDGVQLLSYTHAPDLFRVPELIGFAVLAALALGARRGILVWKDAATLFVASLAAMPLIVFNQQVISGRSLQPIHYELFIANYVGLLAAIMAAHLLWRGRGETARPIPNRILALTALAALGWGTVEATGATRRDIDSARLRDDAMPVIARLAKLAQSEGTGDAVHGTHASRPVVFSSSLLLADTIPTGAPQASLWALHMDAFPGTNIAERKERFYAYMYYSGIGVNELAKAITEGRFAIMVVLFGLERVIPGLTPDPKPITMEEVREEIRRYAEFSSSFTRERAQNPALSYVVVPTAVEPSLANVDRWYERDAGERAGIFTIYRVKLRP